MLGLDFKLLTARQSTPQEWLRSWSRWYDYEAGEQDTSEYACLIGLKGTFTADDFRAISRFAFPSSISCERAAKVRIFASLIKIYSVIVLLVTDTSEGCDETARGAIRKGLPTIRPELAKHSSNLAVQVAAAKGVISRKTSLGRGTTS